jgi:hypothetical protein
MSTQLASHCSLRSCNSSEYCQQVDASQAYTTSLSSDTLWDPKSEPANRQQQQQQQYKQQRPSSVYHQPTTTAHSYIHRYVHPSQVQPVQSSITTTHAYIQPHYTSKPKSWDNLAGKNCGGSYAFGYVVNNSTPNKHQIPPNKNQSMQQSHAPPLPRKAGHAPYGRYSAFADVENYIPAPSQYEAVITKTIITTTKSTENLINNAQYNLSDGSCECIQQPSPKQIIASNCMQCCNAANNAGYYSNLTRNSSNRCIIPTKTEITRL